MTSRVAAIDCGTNSIRLLIADVDQQAGTLTDVVREMRIVRLGEGVDQTKRLSDAALERTFAACDEYAALIAEHEVEKTRFVATSASRDATNAADFVAGVVERIGIEPEVVSGTEEANLSFRGAVSAVPADAPKPYLVIDIGGGSTEFVLGSDSVTHAVSVDMGCVRMTERCLTSDPPTYDETQAAIHDIDAGIAEARHSVPIDQMATLVGLAGSVTTVAAIALGLTEYNPDAIHGARLSMSDVHRVSQELLQATRAERAAISAMHPGRVDVIGAGSLVLDRIMLAAGASHVLVSEHDILDGIAFSAADRV